MKKQKQTMPDIFGKEINRATVNRIKNKRRATQVELTAEHIATGVMLRQVKFNMPHGQFEPWVLDNLQGSLSLRTANRHYQLALCFYKSAAAAEFAALPVEEQQAQLNGEADDTVLINAIAEFLGLD